MKQQLLNLLLVLTAFYSTAQTYPDTFEFRGIHQDFPFTLPGVVVPGPEPAGLDILLLPSPTGRLVSPTLVDMDGDGDTDMVSGSQTTLGKLYYFENIGTTTAPNWVHAALPSLDAIEIAPGGNNETKCDFKDMDNDGDYDLLLGSKVNAMGFNNDDLHYYENTGTATAPNFVESTIPGMANQNMAGFPSIGLVDIDNDKDFDLVCVANDSVSYMQNTGTKFAPVFERKYNLENPWDLDAGPTAFARNWPHGDVLTTVTTFVDIGNDGDYDMCLGRDDGSFRWIENIGTATAPDYDDYAYQTFPGDLGTFDIGQFSSITLGDVTGDGLVDAVLGGFNPGYFAWFQGVDSTLSVDEIDSTEIRILPNPASNIVKISSQIKHVNVYDITGKKVMETNQNTFNVSTLNNGIYLIEITTNNGIKVVKRLIKD